MAQSQIAHEDKNSKSKQIKDKKKFLLVQIHLKWLVILRCQSIDLHLEAKN